MLDKLILYYLRQQHSDAKNVTHQDKITLSFKLSQKIAILVKIFSQLLFAFPIYIVLIVKLTYQSNVIRQEKYQNRQNGSYEKHLDKCQ